VFKRPTTDHAKKSKGGKLRLVLNDDGTPETVSGNHWDDREDILQTVFENGDLIVDHTLAEVRERAAVTEFAQV
jgi:nicotinamide phosphoribosyltransferase